MNAWFVKSGDSEPVGPVSTELVVRGIRAGKVPPDAEVALEFPSGMSPWRALASVPEFAAALPREARAPEALHVPEAPRAPAQLPAPMPPPARPPRADALAESADEPEGDTPPARVAGYVQSDWYVQIGDGPPLGPLSTTAIVRRISRWTIPRDALVALVSAYGSAEWRPLDRVEEFASACALAKGLGEPQKRERSASQIPFAVAAPLPPPPRLPSPGTPAPSRLPAPAPLPPSRRVTPAPPAPPAGEAMGDEPARHSTSGAPLPPPNPPPSRSVAPRGPVAMPPPTPPPRHVGVASHAPPQPARDASPPTAAGPPAAWPPAALPAPASTPPPLPPTALPPPALPPPTPPPSRAAARPTPAPAATPLTPAALADPAPVPEPRMEVASTPLPLATPKTAGEAPSAARLEQTPNPFSAAPPAPTLPALHANRAEASAAIELRGGRPSEAAAAPPLPDDLPPGSYWYLLRPGSRAPEGPFADRELRARVARAEFPHGSKVARPGSRAWKPID